MTRKRLLLAAVLLVLVVMAVLTLRMTSNRSQAKAASAENYLTQAVDRGSIRRTISASGSLTPVNLVQVGTQVSGTIARTHVDFNAAVNRGQLLAEIDTSLLDADVSQAQAQVESAQANVQLARVRHARNQSLYQQGFISLAAQDESWSTLGVAEAALKQQQAATRRAQTNRRNAEIRSPVDGIVVSREVSVGQTVAATLQTPVLFKIAQDLREMQIDTSVSEADVGLLQVGQTVNFTVDAFPDRAFSGRVHQIRNNHVVQQNVVTYTVVVRTRNEDLSLRPGMTGYVTITVGERADALRIPNAALRYEPVGAPPARDGRTANQRTVWRLQGNGAPQAVTVTLGLADNQYTEATAGELRDGDRLIIGERVQSAPLGPKLF